MLTKKEKTVMNSIYFACQDKGSCFISIDEIVEKLPYRLKITKSEITKILQELAYDEYIDLVTSRNCESKFCISLQNKGKAFRRSLEHQKREILFRLLLTISLALLSISITTIIKLLMG